MLRAPAGGGSAFGGSDVASRGILVQKGNKMTEKIFSISEAADYLGVFPLTLRNWEKKGFIISFRTPGGHRRFKKSELDKITGLNGTGDELKKTIKKLEEIVLGNGPRQAIDNVLTDLKNISEKV